MRKNIQLALFTALLAGAAMVGWGSAAQAQDPFSSDYNFIDLSNSLLDSASSTPSPPLEMSIDESGSSTGENLVVEVTGTLNGDNIEG